MPITPVDAMTNKRLSIPPEVFEAFDELITKNISTSGTAIIKQCDAIALVCAKLGIAEDANARRQAGEDILTRSDVFANGWMDVEASYRLVGWEVDYDRPSYCESYEPTYTFSCSINKRGY